MSHTLIKRLLSALLALACLPATGAADVFERDWRQPGDGLLTYDAVNRREWLDLPVSLLTQFPEPHYENAVAELRPGGLFEGFTVAVSGDVLALAESAGINTQTNAAAVNFDATVNLMDLLGTTFDGFRSHGFLDVITEQGGGCPCRLAALFFTGGGGAGLFIASGEDLLRPSTAGLMLYRQAIPEPNSVLLVLFPILSVAIAWGRFYRCARVPQLLCVAVYCCMPVIANAEIFERDWKEAGDGLLTYDNLNHREWLDLPVTRLSQFPEPHYENVEAELAPGGVL